MDTLAILVHTPFPELVLVFAALFGHRALSRGRYARVTRQRWSEVIALVEEKIRDSPYVPESIEPDEG